MCKHYGCADPCPVTTISLSSYFLQIHKFRRDYAVKQQEQVGLTLVRTVKNLRSIRSSMKC